MLAIVCGGRERWLLLLRLRDKRGRFGGIDDEMPMLSWRAEVRTLLTGPRDYEVL